MSFLRIFGGPFPVALGILFVHVGFPLTSQAQVLSASAYCDLMSTACREEVVHDEEFCLAFVADAVPDSISTGTLGDTSGNTLGCRMQYALVAETAQIAGDESARIEACEKASLTGGEACGGFCENYCDLALQTCNTVNNAAYVGSPLFMSGGVPSRSACESACGVYPESVLPGISQQEQLFGYGDTVQCRIHHLQAGVVEGQENSTSYGLHCGHASPTADHDLCSDIAEPNVINYCVFALRHCDGANALFPIPYAHSDCVNFMNLVVSNGDYTEEGFASFSDTDTNSVGCLNNRIMLSAVDANRYCGEGDWDSANWQPFGDAACVESVGVTSSVRGGRIGLGVLLLCVGLVTLGFGMNVVRRVL